MKNMSKKTLFLSILIIFCFYSHAFSDIIYLKSGGKIEGKIISESRGEVKIKTPISIMIVEIDYIDKIEIDEPEDKVERIESELNLETADSSKKELKPAYTSISEEIELAKAPLQETIDSLTDERDFLLAQQSEFEQERIDLFIRQNRLKEELKKVQDSISEEVELARAPLQETIDSLKDERDSLLAQQSKLQEELKTVQASVNSRIQQEKASLQEKVHSLEQELKTVQTSVPEKVELAKAPLQETIDSLKDERDSLLAQQKASLQKEIDSFKEERESLVTQKNKLNEELASAKNEILSLKKALAETESRPSAMEGGAKEEESSPEKPLFPEDIAPAKEPDLSEELLVYGENDQYDQAILTYTKAIEENSEDASAYYNRGSAYFDKGFYSQAVSDFTKTVELRPEYAVAYNDRGVANIYEGQYDRAIRDFTKVIEINPKDAMAYYNRGNAYICKCEYDKAIFDFNKAIKVSPRYEKAYCDRGIAYTCEGEYDQAISDFDRAIEINPKDADVYFNKADACEKAGLTEEALEAYRTFIKYVSPQFVSRIRYAEERIAALER